MWGFAPRPTRGFTRLSSPARERGSSGPLHPAIGARRAFICVKGSGPCVDCEEFFLADTRGHPDQTSFGLLPRLIRRYETLAAIKKRKAPVLPGLTRKICSLRGLLVLIFMHQVRQIKPQGQHARRQAKRKCPYCAHFSPPLVRISEVTSRKARPAAPASSFP
jgi:hypothetical protein